MTPLTDALADYPPAPRGDVVDDYHGTPVSDPYRWLEDVDAPDTRAWVLAQETLTREWLTRTEPDRSALRTRLTHLWDRPRAGTPWRRGGRWFQTRNSGLDNQDLLYVMDGPEASGRVLLDPNALSDDGTVALTGLGVSRDGKLLAYATSAAGSDWMTWHVRDIDSGADRDDVLEWSKFSGAAWAPDGSGFYYCDYPAPSDGAEFAQANYNQRLRFHRLGDDQADDEVCYARPDHPEWGFSAGVTTDGRYLSIGVWHGTHPENRLFYVDLEAGGFDVVELLADADASYDVIGTHGSTWYVLTDRDAPRRRIVAIDLANPAVEQWREVIAQSADTIEHALLVGGQLVVVTLHEAANRIARYALDGAPIGELELAGYVAVAAISGREDDDGFCYSTMSFLASSAVARFDLVSQRSDELVPAGLSLDPTRYATRQEFATSADGTKVSMFVTHRSDITPAGARDAGCALGDHPTLLYGYGGFGIALTPTFSAEWMVWLERGGVLAVANLRGGGEYGDEWHRAGTLDGKQRVFDDAIACGEWLIDHGWTRPERLGVNGRSNGGLLAGALLTQRPDLFGAVVPEVGVLDMLRFHKFTIGWAWVSDYGNPDDVDAFPALHAYSPLHNLRPGTVYPPTLITTGDHDDRVVPGHSFKFAAALQAAQVAAGGTAPILARIDTSAGHGAGKPTAKRIEERADVLAFLTAVLGATP